MILGNQEDFAVPLEEGARGAAENIFGERDGAVLERDVDVFAIEGGFANVVNALWIEAGGLQPLVKRAAGRRGGSRGRGCGIALGRRRPTSQKQQTKQ